MTFDAQESSQADGQPIEIYEFRIGNAISRFTTAADEHTVGGFLYTPAVIKRSRVTVGVEARDEVIELDIPSDVDIVRQYINIPPGALAELDISRLHRNDLGQEVIALFRGRVQSVGFSLLGYRAKLGVAPITEALSRTIPRWVYSMICNNVLYGGSCSVNNALHRVASTVTLVDGSDARLITIPGIVAAIGATARGGGTAQVAGGYVTTDGVDFRAIRAGVGADQLSLSIPFPFDIAGAAIEVFAGCNHREQQCEEVFLNIEGQGGVGGFGGFEFISRENVFRTGVV